MNLFSMILELPLLPLRGVVAVSGVIQKQTEREMYDPAQLRRQIEETDAAVEAGELTEEEAAREQEKILEPTIAAPATGEPEAPESMSDEDEDEDEDEDDAVEEER